MIEIEGRFAFSAGAGDTNLNGVINKAQELFTAFPDTAEGGSERVARIVTQRGVKYALVSGSFDTAVEAIAVLSAVIAEATLRAALVPPSEAWVKDTGADGTTETIRAWPE